MNALRTLYVHALRERLANTNRLLLGGAVFLIPLVIRGFEREGGGLPGGAPATWLSLIFGAGLLGQDEASGVMQLVLSRPVKRFHYALARWFAAVSLAAGPALVQTLIVLAILAAHGQPVAVDAVGAAVVLQLTTAVGVTAVLLAFSSLSPGLADLRFWVLGLLLGEVIELVGNARSIGWVTATGHELAGAMLAGLALDPAAAGWPWLPVVRWASTVTLGLAVAFWSLNRKELSYGGA